MDATESIGDNNQTQNTNQSKDDESPVCIRILTTHFFHFI